MLGDSLRRGLTAGLLAGLLAGLFAFAVGEVPVREAIRLEEQAAAAAADPAAAEGSDEPEFVVDRTTQQALLPVATALVGAALGGLFSLAYAFTRRHLRDHSDWRASLKFGAAAWLAVAVVPALKYPANPPAVGDPDTIASRSGWYVAAVAIGVAGAYGLWLWARWLRRRGVDEVPRQLATAALGAVGFAIVFGVLPPNSDPVEIPARLLWQFRLASLGTQLLLWAGITTLFGWFWHRAAHGSRALTAAAAGP